MSQFNEKYNLKGINIFNSINDIVDTPTIPINDNKYYYSIITVSPKTELKIGYELENNLNKYKSNIIIKKDGQSIYKSIIKINPNNRLICIGDIYGYNDDLKYKCTVCNLVSRDMFYRSIITLNPNNNSYIKFSVYGGAEKLYRAKLISWDDRNKLFKAFTKVPSKKSIIKYKSFIKITDGGDKFYKSLVTISPRSKFIINFDLLSGRLINYNAFVRIGKEYDKLYMARLIINPTNRLICIGNAMGYDEFNYKSMVNITAERRVGYPARVTISLENHIFTKFTIQQTPKHYFYGDLKKDAHVIENNPGSNYGGDNKLFFNNKSIVFMEWEFGENLDTFYKQNLESGSGLRINFKKALPTISNGKVYLVNSNWEEYKINYENKPGNLKLLKEFIVPRNFVGSMDILLGDLFKDIDKGQDKFTISLAVQIDSSIDTYSNSREKGVEIPALYYEYYYIPPNNRQVAYNATIKIKKAYGKGNGVGTEYPSLGEEYPWSNPARIFNCTVYRQMTEPTELYNGMVKVPTTIVGDNNNTVYSAKVFIWNVKSSNFLSNARVKIPKYSIKSEYISRIKIFPLTNKIYKANIRLAKKIKERLYILNLTNIKAYGKGNGIGTEYPGLGKEDKWSGEAPHWKCNIKIMSNQIDTNYIAKIVTVKAYGKGNGKNTEYPALGEQYPWSNPARIFKSMMSIQTEEGNEVYKSIFFNFNKPELIYKSSLYVPKYNKDILYNANVFISTPITKVYGATFDVSLFNNDILYRSTFVNRMISIKIYRSKIRISPERVRVQIFIM